MGLLAQVEEVSSSSSALGLQLLVLVTFIVITVGVAIFPLVDALSRPAWQWRDAHREKGLWVLALVVFPFVTGLVYLLAVRPELAQVGGGEG